MKGLVAANKAKIFKNFLVKILRIVTLDWTTPFLITETTNWIQQTEPEPWVQSLRMIALACCLPLLKFVWHVIQEYINYEMIEMGHRNHTALKVILFRKNMKMTSATSGEFSTGEIHSIVMNDSNLIWSFIWELPGLIECPLRILVSSYFVIKYLGWSGLIVIFAMILQSVLEYVRSKTGSNDDDKRRELNTKRALQINESFNNIKSVKLFGWEGKFIDSIQSIYKKQQELDDKELVRNKCFDMMMHCLHHFVPMVTFTVYKGLGHQMTLSQMILAEMMIHQLRGSIHWIRHLYRRQFDIKESFDKLWRYYCAPETQRGLIKRTNDPEAETAVAIRGNFSWGVTPKMDQAEKNEIRTKMMKKAYKKNTKDMGRIRKGVFDYFNTDKAKNYHITLADRTLKQMVNLKDLDIQLKKGSFNIIIGETGAGKSSLLSAMIGEMIHLTDEEIAMVGDYNRPIKDQEMRGLEHSLLMTDLSQRSPIHLNGTTGFCEQQVWIQNGKFRENILFGSEFDKRKYVETVTACQLESDLAIMPAGDLTEIGEKGINLSGGQKARLALARAVYKRPDVLIMDDPISALDCDVRKKVFDEVFVGLMKEKTRILVTHAVDFVHLADHIIIMKDGEVQAQGSPESLAEHPYILEITEIHNKNKTELKSAKTGGAQEEAVEEVGSMKEPTLESHQSA